jgi:hypothetical protein
MRLLIHINNKEIEIQDIKKLKEHMQYLSELIHTYEETQEEVVFNIPADILTKKCKM